MTTTIDRSVSDGTITQHEGPIVRVAGDVAQLETGIVNLYFVGHPGASSGDWTLVDAGLPFFTHRVIEAAEWLFGPDSKPGAIVLTHGHFDHIGSALELAKKWNVPIFAHPLEMPYITGRSSYPPPDPTVGGGLMARTGMLFPKGPSHFGDHARSLPDDGTVPNMPEWRWIATPGHSPGHVSLFRDRDRMLLAGDAIITQRQESLTGVITKHAELRGPPMYFTPDWVSARESVQKLAALEPSVAATGHGHAMFGERLEDDLRTLARRFDAMAVPSSGRYVNDPAQADETGVTYLPPRPFDAVTTLAVGAALATAVGFAISASRRRDDA